MKSQAQRSGQPRDRRGEYGSVWAAGIAAIPTLGQGQRESSGGTASAGDGKAAGEQGFHPVSRGDTWVLERQVCSHHGKSCSRSSGIVEGVGSQGQPRAHSGSEGLRRKTHTASLI